MRSFLNRLFYKIAHTKNFDVNGLLERLISRKESEERFFYTLNTRPVSTAEVEPTAKKSSAAIVMQGPVNATDDFTLETLKLYTKLTKPELVILSTWVGEDAGQLKQIIDLGITVIQNNRPAFSGNQNINLQITSTASGIKKAKELGATHILKTRTDQRVYATSALQLFSNLIDAFPITDELQKQRLITTSLGTLKYRLYGAGDMLMFGYTDDMLAYWDIEPDDRAMQLQAPESYSISEFSKLRLGEMYMCSKYFEKLGYTLDWTLKQSWELLGKYFCVVDHSSVDLYWPKYDHRTEFRFKYYTAHSLQNLTFADWLELYLGKVITYPEAYLNSPFSKPISSK